MTKAYIKPVDVRGRWGATTRSLIPVLEKYIIQIIILNPSIASANFVLYLQQRLKHHLQMYGEYLLNVFFSKGLTYKLIHIAASVLPKTFPVLVQPCSTASLPPVLVDPNVLVHT